MSTQNITAITNILDKFKIAQPNQRLNIAGKVAATGRVLSESAVDLLTMHFTSTGGDATSLIAESLLSGAWVQLVKELAREKEEQRSTRDEAMAKSDSSRMSKVSESNPYGWDNPEDRRYADHNNPGEWNPFRQSYNLTAREQQTHKTRDYRRRGCSRWEVLGGTKSGTKQSKPHYDALEVATAMGRDFGEVAAAADAAVGERPVYGE